MLDLTPAIPTFVITLREGVEAGLVVGIVLAYLHKATKTDLNPWVYGGVGSGLVSSSLVGVLFGWLIQALGSANQTYAPVVKPLLEGVFGVAAIGMLSWMLIWMTRQARLLKTQIEGAVSQTLSGSTGAGWGIFGLIFFTVLREGFETVLFIAAQLQQGWVPVAGAIAGILAAVGITVLLFKWGVKINLRQFFQGMGVLLLLIVAGLVISALGHIDLAFHRLAQMNPQYENLCIFHDRLATNPSCFLGPLLWDTSKILPKRQFPGIIFRLLLGYEDRPYLLQGLAYLGFWLTIGLTYLRSLSGIGTTTQPASSALQD
jgi:high-affinity iron transporter